MQQLTKRESQLLIYLLEMTEPVTIKQLAEKESRTAQQTEPGYLAKCE